MTKNQEKSTHSQDNEAWPELNQTPSNNMSDEIPQRYVDYTDPRKIPRRFFPNMQPQILSRPVEMPVDPSFHLRSQTPTRVPPEETDLSDAMVYLNRIKEEYADDMSTYDNFLETMRDFKFGKVDAEDVCKAVRILFKNKPHLIDTFNEYLPHHLRYYGDRNPEPVIRQFERPPLQFRRPMFPGTGPHHIPPHHLPPHQPMMPHPMHMHPNMRSPVRPMLPIPKYHMKYPIINQEDVEKTKARLASDFIQKVKRRYANQPNIYKTFVELLHSSQAPNGGNEKIRAEMASLLWENPDLIEEFERNFMPPIKKPKETEIEKTIFQKIKDVLSEKGVQEDFLKLINYFNQNFITAKELIFLLEPILKNEVLSKGLKEFIRYKEPSKEVDMKKLDKMKKIGSYRIFPEPIKADLQDPIARMVLNTVSISCPVFESEDCSYIFLKRNVHEEALFRIEDERSEADLIVERIEYLINALEQVLSELEGNELNMSDLKVSAGIVKEVLKNIYGESVTEIIEGILSRPRQTIPVVIKRLYLVNRKYMADLREKKRIWREAVDRNYFKALDVRGNLFKATEKNLFTIKNITNEAEGNKTINLGFKESLATVRKLLLLYVNSNDKKILEVVELVFDKLNEPNFTASYNFQCYCLFRFILILYERYQELFIQTQKSVKPSEYSINMKYEDDLTVRNRYSAIEEACEEYINKDIDSHQFEDKVRQLSDVKGFKLYNIKKILSKIEKQIVGILENEEIMNVLRGKGGEDCVFKLTCVDKSLRIEILDDHNDRQKYVERMYNLEIDEDLKTHKVYLDRNIKNHLVGGVIKRENICIEDDSYKIKYINDSEGLYVSYSSKRNKK